MNNLKTVDQAKKKIMNLQAYVDLAEGFHASTLEEVIIKEYAFVGSIVKVAEIVNEMGFRLNGVSVEPEDVSNIIKGRGNNELHKVIRAGYLKKTRHTRRKF